MAKIDIQFPEDFYLDDVGVWRLKKEKLAEMEDPRQLTNEEWIRSCSTEQLAEFLFEIGEYGWLKEIVVTSDKALRITDIAEWLKQPHTGGES